MAQHTHRAELPSPAVADAAAALGAGRRANTALMARTADALMAERGTLMVTAVQRLGGGREGARLRMTPSGLGACYIRAPSRSVHVEIVFEDALSLASVSETFAGRGGDEFEAGVARLVERCLGQAVEWWYLRKDEVLSNNLHGYDSVSKRVSLIGYAMPRVI